VGVWSISSANSALGDAGWAFFIDKTIEIVLAATKVRDRDPKLLIDLLSLNGLRGAG
jgi:hypothetical protein